MISIMHILLNKSIYFNKILLTPSFWLLHTHVQKITEKQWQPLIQSHNFPPTFCPNFTGKVTSILYNILNMVKYVIKK